MFRWILLLPLMMTSCQKNETWKNLSIKTNQPQFYSAKLIYPVTNFTHDIEIEFLHASGNLSAYLNVYYDKIPPYNDNESIAQITFQTKEGDSTLLVHRLAGGQRLKIPEESLGLVVEMFKKNKWIVLKLSSSYKTKIITEDFKKHFEHLKAAPPLLSMPTISLSL